MKPFFTSILFFFLTVPVLADCNFKQGEFISELKDPKNISSITIIVSKSRKWQKNFFNIITSPSKNIPPKLKKYFTAKLKINYKFGLCEFWARIKQNGDWRDHISFESGKMVRSINVKFLPKKIKKHKSAQINKFHFFSKIMFHFNKFDKIKTKGLLFILSMHSRKNFLYHCHSFTHLFFFIFFFIVFAHIKPLNNIFIDPWCRTYGKADSKGYDESS